LKNTSIEVPVREAVAEKISTISQEEMREVEESENINITITRIIGKFFRKTWPIESLDM
jgi:hypothetical protein